MKTKIIISFLFASILFSCKDSETPSTDPTLKTKEPTSKYLIGEWKVKEYVYGNVTHMRDSASYTATITSETDSTIKIVTLSENKPIYRLKSMVFVVDWKNKKIKKAPGTTLKGGDITDENEFDNSYSYGTRDDLYSVYQIFTR